MFKRHIYTSLNGLIVLLLILLMQNGHATPAHLQKYDLFGEETPIKIELAFDYKMFIKQKFKDEYQPVDITFFLSEDDSITQTIKMKARGEFRKTYCQIPPIKLNFKDADFSNTFQNHLDKLKLVTACRFQTIFQQYLMKEYLTYKAYQLITPMSFKVRLVEITYRDSKGKKKPFTQFGFLIEDVDDLAERNECFELEPEVAAASQTDQELLAIVEVFQYMIGNTDYLVHNLHNLKLLKSNDPANQAAPYVVPYDFDYSGMVNAHYAIPHELLGIENVRERSYRGTCRSMEELIEAFKVFQEVKTDLFALFSNSDLIEKKTKKECVRYLEEFYEVIDSNSAIQREFRFKCKDQN